MFLQGKLRFFALLTTLSIPAFVFAEPYPIEIIGGDATSLTPALDPKEEQGKRENVDVVVVGGGLSGLTAALYLGDAKKNVLLLEKEPVFGGLAAYGKDDAGKFFDRGAAYWTGAYEEETKILERIGLANFEEKFAIREPIDSYLWNGELYENLWDDEATLARLPQSFPLLKQALRKIEKRIPNQPIEDDAIVKEFDRMNAAQWVMSLPQQFSKSKDAAEQKLVRTFFSDKRVNFKDRNGMGELLDFLNLFCRSALGSTCDEVSTVAFFNFYISEIDTRYTSLQGTGIAAVKLLQELKKLKNVTLRTSAPVGKIMHRANGATIYYRDSLDGGNVKAVNAAYVVYAAPLLSMGKLVDGFGDKVGKEHKKVLDKLEYSHYTVHVASVKGHPYRKSYDTWVRAKDAKPDDFTDLILGQWVDPTIDGYEGMRNFEADPKGDGIMSIYQPHPRGKVRKNYSDEETKSFTLSVVERMKEIFAPLSGPKNVAEKDRIQVQKVWTSRWPFSIHVVRPGFFSDVAPVLRKPVGRIFTAHSNIGTPAFEEALFRGHCAANQILRITNANFKDEEWTNCPQ